MVAMGVFLAKYLLIGAISCHFEGLCFLIYFGEQTSDIALTGEISIGLFEVSFSPELVLSLLLLLPKLDLFSFFELTRCLCRFIVSATPIIRASTRPITSVWTLYILNFLERSSLTYRII